MFVLIEIIYVVIDEKYYASEAIKCKDGSKFFNRARLNDNFCDCVDGTDEPGNTLKLEYIACRVEILQQIWNLNCRVRNFCLLWLNGNSGLALYAACPCSIVMWKT